MVERDAGQALLDEAIEVALAAGASITELSRTTGIARTNAVPPPQPQRRLTAEAVQQPLQAPEVATLTSVAAATEGPLAVE